MTTNNEWIEIEALRLTYGGVYQGDATRIRRMAAHGVTDSKGRAIGGMATIAAYPDGKIFLTVMATRDGKTFGAGQSGKRCATLEQAKALATQKFAAQAQRYRALAERHRL